MRARGRVTAAEQGGSHQHQFPGVEIVLQSHKTLPLGETATGACLAIFEAF